VLVTKPRDPTGTDEDLLLQAGRGSREAFAALVDRHHESVLRLAFFLVGDRETARDLTQDCFLRLLRAAPRYESRGKFRSYLLTIARRLAYDARARAWERRESLEAEPPSPDPGPDEVWERRERAERLGSVLATLADEDREALVLSEVGGLRYREIAEMAGVPEGTIASRKNRALRLVRERWPDGGKEMTA
jgi:RNA polymerase sigma-70 factor (ECF subfamily)